jgi:hypothetical protein
VAEFWNLTGIAHKTSERRPVSPAGLSAGRRAVDVHDGGAASRAYDNDMALLGPGIARRLCGRRSRVLPAMAIAVDHVRLILQVN